MNAKHTPEPWFLHPASGSEHTIGGYISNDLDRRGAPPICDIRGFAGLPHKDNADRIVACVNACAGIEDPAELRRQRDELLEALENLLNDETWAAEEAARKAIEKAKKETK